MAWSTKQLADLAGVSLRSIRHWHEVGLLPEPERLANNYKQYTTGHLVLTIRIKRLTSLGFSLEQVADMLASTTDARTSLQELRDELTDTITRLERIRTDLDRMLTLGVAPDLSPEALRAVEAFGGDETGRGIAIVFAHLFPAGDTAALTDALADAPSEIAALNSEFAQLSDDASPQQITTIVEAIIESVETFLADHPELGTAGPRKKGDRAKADAFITTILDGLNLAQREAMSQVIQRLSVLTETPGNPDD